MSRDTYRMFNCSSWWTFFFPLYTFCMVIHFSSPLQQLMTSNFQGFLS